MALFLAGHPPSNIMLLGRWRSTAFLHYLRPQILEWTSSLSPTMLRTEDFRDADAPHLPQQLTTTPHCPPPPSHSPIPFNGFQFSQGEMDLMVCPEKDTDPEKDTKKGGKGVTTINQQQQRQEHTVCTSLATLTKNLSNKSEAGPHSNRRIHRTVFDAARIVDRSEGSNERDKSKSKRKRHHSTEQNSTSAPGMSYKWMSHSFLPKPHTASVSRRDCRRRDT